MYGNRNLFLLPSGVKPYLPTDSLQTLMKKARPKSHGETGRSRTESWGSESRCFFILHSAFPTRSSLFILHSAFHSAVVFAAMVANTRIDVSLHRCFAGG